MLLAMIFRCQLGYFRCVLIMMQVLKLVFIVRAIIEDDNTHVALLADATNAFHLANRQATLHNISVLRPSFSATLKNMHLWFAYSTFYYW